MKLNKKQFIVVSFMLFSLFFGAGNLIFPPFLGHQAGQNTWIAILGFLITAVVLPVLGVVIVAKFDGLDKLAGKVNKTFAVIFTVTILLAIGPGLGIPRAASVPFEMAIAPYLKEGLNPRLFMLLYSFVFFMLALWLSLTPTKLPKRIGYILTPTLLILLITFFTTFMFKGEFVNSNAIGDYLDKAFIIGFVDGYQTMDTIAALNFGLVISNTLLSMGIEDNNSRVKQTLKCGIFAGSILAGIYLMLAFMGMAGSGDMGAVANGAIILRKIVYSIFGDFGAYLLGAIFTLACLTTCVGLITSISNYFSVTFGNKKKYFSYKSTAIFITVISFLICNLGLNTILSISVPVLNAVYPISIVLILLGLFNKFYSKNKYVFPITIYTTGVLSVAYAIYQVIGIETVLDSISLFKLGFIWVPFTVVAFVVALLIGYFNKKKVSE